MLPFISFYIYYKGYRVSYTINPWRWIVDNDVSTTTDWTYYYTFYAFSSKRPGTTQYSVLFATMPDRNKISSDQHHSTNTWKYKFSFWAYDYEKDETAPNYVAYADNPLRHRISKNEHTSSNGWTHSFTFWTFQFSPG